LLRPAALSPDLVQNKANPDGFARDSSAATATGIAAIANVKASALVIGPRQGRNFSEPAGMSKFYRS
jgi:hypothetical protein